MTVTIHEAKTNLSRLLREMEAGEEVIIARGKEPIARLAPIEKPPRKRQLGGARDCLIYMADDFNDELEDFADYG